MKMLTLTNAQVAARLTNGAAKDALQRLSKLGSDWTFQLNPDVSPGNPEGKKYYLVLANVYTRPPEETKSLYGYGTAKGAAFCNSFDEGVVNQFEELTGFLTESGRIAIVSTEAEREAGTGRPFFYNPAVRRFLNPGEKVSLTDIKVSTAKPTPVFPKKITVRKRSLK